MTEKRYYSVDYDEQYYIFDSDVIRKGRVEEEAEYSYDVFADSMSGDEIVDLLNEQDKRIKELEEENASMKGRIINAIVKSNQVECNCSPCICEDYVNEELKKW